MSESIVTTYARAADGVRRANGGVLSLASGPLTVEKIGRRRAVVVDGDGRRCRVQVQDLVASLRSPLEAIVGYRITPVLGAAGNSARRRFRLRRFLLDAHVGTQPLTVGWAAPGIPSISLRGFVRSARLWPLAAATLGVYVAAYALFLLGWRSLGRDAESGGLDASAVARWFPLAVAFAIAMATGAWLAGRFAAATGRALKRRLFDAIVDVEPDQMRHRGGGQLLGLTMEADAFESLAVTGGQLALLGTLELAVSIIALSAGVRGPLLLCVLAVWLIVAALASWRQFRHRKAWTDQRLSITHRLVERLVGHRTLLAQGAPDEHREDRPTLADYSRTAKRMDRSAAVLVGVVPHAWLATGVAVLLIPSVPEQGTGVALAIGGVLLGTAALRKLALASSDLTAAAVAWSQLAPLLGEPRPPETPTTADPDSDEQAMVEARDVYYTHARRRRPALQGASMTVRRGDRVVLDGPSGGGKSTLVALLCGLRTPERGDIVRHGRLTPVPQFHENHVFSASLAFNLLCGHQWPPGPDDLAAADELCRELGLGPLLDEMPAGIAQPVGETGWQLSHGERSRVFIARALLQRPDLIVLDESLAALDPESLAQVLRTIDQRVPTLMVVEHLTTTRPTH